MGITNLLEWLAFGLIALITGLVISELVARLWLKIRGRWYPWPPHYNGELHLLPGVFPGFPTKTRIWTNRLGARGDRPPKPASDCLRLMVAGGSAAECYFLDQPLTWPEQIVQVLEQPKNLKTLGVHSVHINNFARSGQRCADVADTLKRVGPRVGKIDAIVLMVGAGDMIRWMEQGSPIDIVATNTNKVELYAMHPVLHGSIWRLLALRRIISWLKLTITRPLQIRHNVGNAIKIARARRMQSTTTNAPIPNPAGMLKSFELALHELITTAQQLAPKVILVQQPHFGRPPTPAEKKLLWNFGNGPVFERDVEHYYNHPAVIALWQKINEIVANIGNRGGVDAIVNGQLAVQPGSECFYDFAHLNPVGAQMLGAQVATTILSLPTTSANS